MKNLVHSFGQLRYAIIWLSMLVVIASGCSMHRESLSLSEWDPNVWKESTGIWQPIGAAWLDRRKDTLAVKPGKGILYHKGSPTPSHLISVREHGDCEIHAEVLLPPNAETGIFLQSRYEVQIRDSYDDTISTSLHTMGAIYCRQRDHETYEGMAPIYNAANPAGAWNRIDIKFRAPRFTWNGRKLSNAYFEYVLVNGLEVQRDVEVSGPTIGATSHVERSLGPLMLQGGKTPVAWRNVVIKYLD